MDDRELIARAIDKRNWDSFYDGFREDSWEHKQRRASLEQADAVLAALGDRLVGSVPEWVQEVTVTLLGDSRPDEFGGETFYRTAFGHGKNLESALVAALTEVGKDAQVG